MTAHAFYTEIIIDPLRFFAHGLNWRAFHAHIAFFTFIEIESRFRVEKTYHSDQGFAVSLFSAPQALGQFKIS